MADKKISELTDGSAASATDVFPIERNSTANYKLTLQYVLDLIATYLFPTLNATAVAVQDDITVSGDANITGSIGVGVAAGATNKVEIVSDTVKPTVIRNTTATSNASLRLYNDQNSSARSLELDYFGSTAIGGERAEIFTTGAYPLNLSTNYTKRILIDGSGRIAIGGTQANWSGFTTPVDVNNNGSIATNGSTLFTGHNFYFNSGWKAKAVTGSAMIGYTTNAINFYVAPTVTTAGDPISWGTALTIDGANSKVAVQAGYTFSTPGLTVTGTTTGIIPIGVIVMWTGTIASVPSGWALCDGTNGTPDLRNKFIIGAYADAGNIAQTTVTNPTAPTYTKYGGTKDAIVVSHTHSITDPGHSHSYIQPDAPHVICPPSSPTSAIDSRTPTSTGTSTTGISINSAGSDGTNQNLPPYYALAFIMKTT
jgi:hypothetical protein